MVLSAVLVQLYPGQLIKVRAQGRSSVQTASDGLTLPGAIEIALRSNPMIRATSAGREMADAQVGEARASRSPLLQLGETFIRSNNPVFVFGSLLEQGRFGPQNFDPHVLNNPDSLGNFRSSITFRLPLFDQKQSDTRISQARIGQQQADAQKESVEQQIRFDVLRAYYGVLVAQAKKEVADEAVKSAAADVKRIGDLVDAGVVVQSDSLSAEVQLAEFHQQQIQAEGDLAIAQAALNTVLGVAVETPQKVTGQLGEKTFKVGTQAELIRLALDRRADLARAGLALKSGKERTRGVRGEYLPRVDAFGAFGISAQNLANGSSDYTVGASVTFNLFDAGRSARLKQARAAENAAAAEAENLASQIRFEVVRAYQQYVSARERVSVSARAVAQANEARRIVQDRYQAGLTTITEVLRTETTYVRARTSLLAARNDHYIGYANVLLATGRLTAVDDFVS
ncbi:MAG TPA: TolC family protein [Blastocatellia bacterium]|nr:TolC family protein [Blastocatellia bacterium]